MKRIILFATYLLLLCFLFSCSENSPVDTLSEGVHRPMTAETAEQTLDTFFEPMIPSLTVTFFDVGKADFILIQTGGKTAVIDTGYSDNWELVEKALIDRSITNVDILIATHPDKDHIGCMNKVMKNFSVSTLYMSPIEDKGKEYEKMLKAADKNNVSVQKAAVGDTFTLGEAEFFTVSPGEDILELKDENEASVVLLMKYKNIKVLFSADAQFEAEEKMVDGEYDISADVIKIGHHGSAQASSASYLDKVGARYAVISTGDADGEKYISSETVRKLNERNMITYRTDLQGNVIMHTDGERIEFETEY